MNEDRTNLNTALDNYLKSGQQFGERREILSIGLRSCSARQKSLQRV